MDDSPIEEILVKEYLSALENEWNIVREVKGHSTISGKQKRIDAIIMSKTYPHMIFGIEFKREDLGSFNKFTHWFKQAITYTQCLWYGKNEKKYRLPILIAPTPSYGNIEMTTIFTRLVGEFGVGDINRFWNGHFKKMVYQIRIKEVRIWCNIHGYNKSTINWDFNQLLNL